MDPLHNAPLDDGRRPPHPFLYTILIVPFGATTGFVSVALAFLATRVGLTVEQGAELIAVSMFPNVWKFLWAPIGDRTLTRKLWYLISAVACAAGMAAMAIVPLGKSTLLVMDGIILITSIAATFLGFAVEGMVAHITPPDDRGRVSGWFQAGNLGGAGIGGGLGLWLLNVMPAPWIAGTVLGLTMLACCAPLWFIRDVDAVRTAGVEGVSFVGGVWAAVKHVLVDLWDVLRSRPGLLCAILCFIPIGTGAAQGVLVQAEVAGFWGAGAHEVELVQGFVTGLISMAGCLAGGYICAKWWNARVAYAIFGGVMAAVTAGMAFAPKTVAMYVAFSLAYAFVTGLCYAAFSAFVLEAIGAGHAATKYSVFASLSNTPIWYCGLVLAFAETKWGPAKMLLVESGLGVAGIAVFVLSLLIIPTRGQPATVLSEAA